MLTRSLASIALTVAITGLTSCSGGGGGATANILVCGGTDQNSMCLVSCNLGCTDIGCELSEIAQNQPLSFSFSQVLDPASINSASLSIRTATGEEPVGVLQVVGDRIEFVPEVQVVGGVSFFGFRPAESYIVTLQGGGENLNAVRGLSGDPLRETISCTLNVTRGIVDLNGAPPAARLLTPTGVENVPIGTSIVLEFNELIDISAFSGTTVANGPVRIRMRRTRPAPSGSGRTIECNPSASPVQVIGTPRLSLDPIQGVTVFTFQPTISVPGEICVEIEVTEGVRDLAGIRARPQVFQFTTEFRPKTTDLVEEDFVSDGRLDRAASAGTWANGEGRFGLLGGTGELGEFDIENGVSLGGGVYEWNTDSLTIPGSQTPSGQSVTVTDGVFEFSNVVIPAGQTLRLVGSQPAVFISSGQIQVLGTIDASGATVGGGINSGVSVTQRDGGVGGPGGGTGGLGGSSGNGANGQPANDGADGADVNVPVGHAYASQAVGTGGKGSLQFPLDGRNSSIIFVAFITQMFTGGGGGGGYLSAGGDGLAITNSSGNPATIGPDADGGAAFDILNTLTRPAGISTLDYFLVGGSGGGGAGSHPMFTNQFVTLWAPGVGGGGGGGALCLRAGDSLVIDSGATVTVAGGATPDYISSVAPVQTPAIGGAGAAGSLILQSGRAADVRGLLDARGGVGGTLDVGAATSSADGKGGDGSNGMFILELPGLSGGNPATLLPGALPVATSQNIGDLQDSDDQTSFQSRWYFTNQILGPEFLRYEIEAELDGVLVTYSDDPATPAGNVGPATFANSPISATWQAADLDPLTLEPPFGADLPFRQFVGRGLTPSGLTLADDALNGFRFKIAFNRALGQTVVIKSVKVYFQF